MTRTTREHPTPEEIAAMDNATLAAFVETETDFLESEEQRRVPVSTATAVREMKRRWLATEQRLGALHEMVMKQHLPEDA